MADAPNSHRIGTERTPGTGHGIDNATAQWLGERDDKILGKLADVGLIPRRNSASLGAFLRNYVESRADVKGSTATVYGHTKRCLLEYFGADKPLREITSGEADQWRLWLAKANRTRTPRTAVRGLADNTVRRRCGIAKQFSRQHPPSAKSW